MSQSCEDSKLLLTWVVKPESGTHQGRAGGVLLFGISWVGGGPDAKWLMRTSLPGVNTRWRHSDEAKLRTAAEQILAGWLERVQGGATP